MSFFNNFKILSSYYGRIKKNGYDCHEFFFEFCFEIKSRRLQDHYTENRWKNDKTEISRIAKSFSWKKKTNLLPRCDSGQISERCEAWRSGSKCRNIKNICFINSICLLLLSDLIQQALMCVHSSITPIFPFPRLNQNFLSLPKIAIRYRPTLFRVCFAIKITCTLVQNHFPSLRPYFHLVMTPSATDALKDLTYTPLFRCFFSAAFWAVGLFCGL